MTVHFVGAGPGAADLITLRAASYLAGADVVLYPGTYIDAAVLTHCRDDANLVDTQELDLDQITAAVLASLEHYGLDEPALRLARGIVRSNAESVRRGADPGDVVAETRASLRAAGWEP